VKNINHIISIPFEAFKGKLIAFIKESGAEYGNVKIEVYFSIENLSELCYKAFYIPTSYPDEILYREGVVCHFLDAIRENPSIKMANPKLRNLSDAIINKENIYETILVNQDGLVTEGSRSNIFFIKSGTIYTAPSHLVLEGIMRQKVIQVIADNGISIEQNAVPKNDIHLFDACFITGTSPRVLPIKEIANVKFKVPDRVTTKISDLINNMVTNHISNQL
jgi:branched-chain amino acid aminotransferase